MNYFILQARWFDNTPTLYTFRCRTCLSRILCNFRGRRWLGFCIHYGSGFLISRIFNFLRENNQNERFISCLLLSIILILGFKCDFTHFIWTFWVTSTSKEIVGASCWQRLIYFFVFFLVSFICCNNQFMFTSSGSTFLNGYLQFAWIIIPILLMIVICSTGLSSHQFYNSVTGRRRHKWEILHTTR